MVTVQPIREKEKIDKIKSYLRDNPRDYLLFVLGLNTALRVGDILKLRVGDVRRYDKIRDILKVRISKTKKEKRVALNKGAKEALKFFFLCTPDLADSDFLFTGRGRSKPMSRVNAWMRLQRIARKFGLEEFGTHSLRKTWGLQARKAGIDISIIQEKLGHSTPSVTRRYIGITDDEVNEVEREFIL